MILFILLYAISTVNQDKYEKLSSSLNEALGSGTGGDATNKILTGAGSTLDGGGGALEGVDPGDNEENQTTTDETTANDTTTDTTGAVKAEQKQIEDIKYNINHIIADYSLEDNVGIVIQESGLVISFSDDLLFDSGEATLKESMKKGLQRIAIEMNKIDNPILVKGHTDNVPVKVGLYSSNWQLSAARAANVVQYLDEKGHVDGSRLSAIGCGQNQTIASNDTKEGRSKNRRIEIIIIYDSKVEIPQ